MDVCRICLLYANAGININNIYQDQYDLRGLIEDLCADEIEASADDSELSQVLCKLCASKLVECHVFRRLIITSHRKFLDEFLCRRNEKAVDQFANDAGDTADDQIGIGNASPSDEDGNEVQLITEHQAGRCVALEVTPLPLLLHKCGICSAKLQTEFSLKKHLQYVHKSTFGERPPAIDPMNGESTELEALFANAERMICEKCNRSFGKRSAFLKHFRYVHLKHLFRSKRKCPLCPRLFSGMGTSSNIQRHIKTVHQRISRMNKGQILLVDSDNCIDAEGVAPAEQPKSRLTVRCIDCDSCFANAIDLYEHSKNHRTNGHETIDGFDLNCDHCHARHSTMDEFTRHMNEVHSAMGKMAIRPIKCHWCGERFVRIQGLYSHIRYAHSFNKVEDKGAVVVAAPTANVEVDSRRLPPEKQNACLCTICGKFLSTPVALTTHSLIHSNAKPFKCSICSASFRQYNTLYIHKSIHSDERKYCCKECGKSFRQNAHLKTHLKTHGIGIDKWHACNICHKQFYSKGNLTVHMWVHKSGHPFQCTHCHKGFSRKNKLSVHVKKEHMHEKEQEENSVE